MSAYVHILLCCMTWVSTGVLCCLLCVCCRVGVSCNVQLRHHICCWAFAVANSSSCRETSEPAPAAATALAVWSYAWLQCLRLLQRQSVRPCSVQLWCQCARRQRCQSDEALVAWIACDRGMAAVACVTCWYTLARSLDLLGAP